MSFFFFRTIVPEGELRSGCILFIRFFFRVFRGVVNANHVSAFAPKIPMKSLVFFLSFLLFESLACSSSSKMQILPNVDEGKLILIFICEY